MSSAAHREKPLMLKDFLELDANSDSFSGFQWVPRRSWAHNASTSTVRCLLEAEFYGGSLVRSRSKSAFEKISAVVKNLHRSSPTRTNKTFLPKSFSKKFISGSFWKKRVKESEKVRVKDIVRVDSLELYGERRSLYVPSPVLSSGRSSSCSERDGSSKSTEFVLSSNGSFDSSATGENRRDSALQSPKRNIVVESDHNKKQEECRGCLSEEEKEQLSPVSVMDFPYQDDAEDEEDEDDDDDNNEATSSSPCFEQSLANIERTKHELLQKIRRFESLAELDPIDLTASFTSVENHVDHEEEGTAADVIQRLRSDGYPVGPHKKLLLDFFAEEMTLDADVEELLAAAEDWIRGHRHGEAQIDDMERNRRWRCFEEEEKKELAADVETEVLGSLVDELVLDVLLF